MTELTFTCDGAGDWAVIPLDADVLARIGTQIVARDAAGGLLPSQTDLIEGGAEVVVRTKGMSGQRLTLAPGQAETPAEIACNTVREHEGQESYRVQTPACTWVFHKLGGGFASLFDGAGRDWISFRPWGGSDGIYRGIPNCAYPENVFHPGHDTTRMTAPVAGPLRVSWVTESKDGKWRARYAIYPDHAEFTMLKFGHPYWLLYEGTPGGKLEEDRDFCIRSDGLRRPLLERWDEELPAPKWIGFGKEGLDEVLWLQSHAPEHQTCRDSFWPMEGNMTVFGFGRVGMDMTMNHAPARFSFGLTAAGNHGALPGRIAAISQRRTCDMR